METAKKAGPPPITVAELKLSDSQLLARLQQCYEHLSHENLVQAIAKLKWAQQYGPHGDRTNAFEPDGEPLRFSTTVDHWIWALDFNNAGVGNYKALQRYAKHDPSRNEYQRKYQKKRYHGRKKQAIKMLGGKCSVCGTTSGLELDHKDPDKKSFNVTKLWSVPEAEFKREVKKCKLLCKKHHRERTGKQRENGDVKSIPGKTQYDGKGRKTKKRRKKTAAYYSRVLELQLRWLRLRTATLGAEGEFGALYDAMEKTVLSSLKKVVDSLRDIKGADTGKVSRYGFLTAQSLLKTIKKYRPGEPIKWVDDYLPKLRQIIDKGKGISTEAAALIYQLFRFLKKNVGVMLGGLGKVPPQKLWLLLTRIKEGADRAVEQAKRFSKLQPLQQKEVGFILQKVRGGFAGFNLWESVPVGHDQSFFKRFKVRNEGKLPGWKFFLEGSDGKKRKLKYTDKWAVGQIGKDEYNLAASGFFKAHPSHMWKTVYVLPGKTGYTETDLPAPEATPSAEELFLRKEEAALSASYSRLANRIARVVEVLHGQDQTGRPAEASGPHKEDEGAGS